MPYRMNTPYQSLTFPTLAAARKAAHAGLDSIAAKRGYSMVETSRRVGNRVLHFFTVTNSKGKSMTGCVIYKDDSVRGTSKTYTSMTAAQRKEMRDKMRRRSQRTSIRMA